MAGCGVAAVLAGGLPGAIPYTTFANLGALSDTLVMIPLWNLLYFRHVEADSLARLIIGLHARSGVLFLFWPRRLALVPAALVLGWFILLQVPVEKQINATSHGVLAQGLLARRSWIDEAVGGKGEVAALWTGNASPMVVFQNEFFNRSVHPVYAFAGGPALSNPISQTSVMVDQETGAIEGPDGRSVRAEYALADRSVDLAGREVASDPVLHTGLYRVGGDLRLAGQLAGVYPDAWTGRRCDIYALAMPRGQPARRRWRAWPGLFKKAQTLAAEAGNRVVARVRDAAPGVEPSGAALSEPGSLRGRGSTSLGPPFLPTSLGFPTRGRSAFGSTEPTTSLLGTDESHHRPRIRSRASRAGFQRLPARVALA